jgi:MFS family permease
LRFAGQGLLTMTSRTVMGKWFERRRGLASAIMGTAIAGGFGVTPWLFGEVLDGFGWRGAWLLMAAVVGIGMGLIAWLLVRDNPEECGLEMDGGAAESADAPAGKRREPRVEVRTYHEATRGQALRTVAFWATSGALAVQGLVITGITFHLEAIGAESGLGRDASRMLFMPMAVVATIVGALAGLACDYVRIKWLLITMGCFQALGFAASAHLDRSLGWWLAVVGLGFSGGFFGPISSVAMPRFFGRANLGAINGVQMMVMVLSSAIGPSFLALFERYGGSFGPGLYWSCAFPLVVSIVALWATNPQVRWKHTPPIG